MFRNRGMFRFLKFAAILSIILSSGESLASIEAVGSVSTLQLPNSGYHFVSFDAQLAFREASAAWMIQLGSTPPFSAHGFTQLIPYLSINREWLTSPSGFALFG